MKKVTLPLILILSLFLNGKAQTRYLDEVFSSVDVAANVVYGQNYTVLTGSPQLQPLVMDVYTPSGDMATDRPLIVFMHTGSFLPKYINQLPTGGKTDSATVELCKIFARKGYVVANIDYRTGWNPQGSQDERTQTIIQAVYRGLQDAKTAVRFFRKDFANGNSYGIDETKIAVGGQGSAGYISIAYGCLNKLSEIQMTKFYNFTTNSFMVDTAIMGDWDGFGGNAALNVSNHYGYSSDVLMTFNIGGAVGDSSWLEDGEIPIASIHGVADAFTPFGYGIVYVPGTSLFVVDVSGSSDVQRITNSFGNNNIFRWPAINDAYTNAADSYNDGLNANYGNGTDEGLFPIVGVANGNGAWEWWDDNAVIQEAPFYGQDGQTCVNNGYASNPVYQAMGPVAGAMRAKAYVDTIQGYVTPRLYRALIEQPYNIQKNVLTQQLDCYPNPNNGKLFIATNEGNFIENITVFNMQGQLIKNINVNRYGNTSIDVPCATGMYYVQIKSDIGNTVKMIYFY